MIFSSVFTSTRTSCVGKPVIRGTRITVEHIMNELAVGMTLQRLSSNTALNSEQDTGRPQPPASARNFWASTA